MLSVSSSDPVNGGSDGDQSPDWEVIDEHHVRLRAEKANNGQARYYTIKITITDGCNAPVDTSVTVVVAHNITGPAQVNHLKLVLLFRSMECSGINKEISIQQSGW
jgi:hypothetical protein